MTAPHKSRAYFPERSYALVTCVGCNTPLLRDEPENNVRGASNWMLTCGYCQRRLCVVCLADGAECCTRCSAERNRIELRGLVA